MIKRHRNKLLAVLFILLLLADQLSKTVAVESGIATFNSGISLSLLAGSNSLSLLVSVFGLVIMAWLLKDLQKFAEGRGLLLFGSTLLLAGSLGNIADRLLRGAVVDFIRIGQLPVFNLADILISTGIVLLLLVSFRHEQYRKNLHSKN